jgi:tripartite-type tricarboxylate transporter receptor subunit TctC
VYAPAKTPSEIVSLLNRELNAIIQSPAVVEKLAMLGITTKGGTAEAAQARVAVEVSKWANVIRSGNLVLN